MVCNDTTSTSTLLSLRQGQQVGRVSHRHGQGRQLSVRVLGTWMPMAGGQEAPPHLLSHGVAYGRHTGIYIVCVSGQIKGSCTGISVSDACPSCTRNAGCRQGIYTIKRVQGAPGAFCVGGSAGSGEGTVGQSVACRHMVVGAVTGWRSLPATGRQGAGCGTDA